MKIDAHQHFWQYDPIEYGWIGSNMPEIMRDFGPQDLWQVQGPMGFDGSIAVQARQSLQETQFLLRLAEQDARIKGVVGWVDLRSDRLEIQLEQLAKHSKLVGIRHVLQDEDPAFLLDASFRRGIGMLHHFGLTYDLLLFPRHLPNAIRLVEEFPEQAFVLDHISKPLIKAGILEPWKTEIQTLAQNPNVLCKLSGMVTETNWKQWEVADFRPYLDVVWDAFGEDRLMIGSDWPVCLLSGSYTDTMNIVVSYLHTFSPEIQRKVLGENCMTFYKK